MKIQNKFLVEKVVPLYPLQKGDGSPVTDKRGNTIECAELILAIPRHDDFGIETAELDYYHMQAFGEVAKEIDNLHAKKQLEGYRAEISFYIGSRPWKNETKEGWNTSMRVNAIRVSK